LNCVIYYVDRYITFFFLYGINQWSKNYNDGKNSAYFFNLIFSFDKENFINKSIRCTQNLTKYNGHSNLYNQNSSD
jgi:hypothetical protein